MKKVPRDYFNMGDGSNKSNATELNATNNNDELNWVREDMFVTIFDKASNVGEKSTSEDEIDDTLFD